MFEAWGVAAAQFFPLYRVTGHRSFQAVGSLFLVGEGITILLTTALNKTGFSRESAQELEKVSRQNDLGVRECLYEMGGSLACALCG